MQNPPVPLTYTPIEPDPTEARFRQVFDSNIVGMFFAHTDGRIVDANDAFLRIVGYSRQDMLDGKLRWAEMTPPEYAALDERAGRDLQERGACEPLEKEFIRKDGSRVSVLLATAAFSSESQMVTVFALDLSERRRAEAAARRADASLRASEARLRRMFESNLVGMVIAHFDGRIVEANHAFLRMLGYTREDVAAGRVRWDNLTPPEFADADARAVRDLTERGHCEPYEKAFLRNDGTRVPILLAPYEFDIATGFGPAFVMDLSARRRAEEGERTALAQLRIALETARMAVWEWEPQSRVSTVAGDMTETYGVPAPKANELLNHIHPEDHAIVLESVRKTLSDGGPNECEFRAVRPDGQIRWVRDVSRRRIGPDGLPRLAGVSIDVTAQKVAELARREGERRFDMVVANSPDSMFCQDADLRIVWLSKPLPPPLNHADVIGQTDEIFLGRTEHLRLAAIKRQILADGIGRRVETVAHVEGVGLVYVEVALERWHDVNGRVLGIAGYSRDITERKRAEQEMRALNESLERRVDERTAELREANAALQQEVADRQRAEAELRSANAELENLADHNRRLAREVEHRVRNNLAALLALVHVMGEAAPDVVTFSRAMESRLTAMAHTHRLLAEASWRAIDLRTLVESALGAMRHMAQFPNPTSALGPAVLLSPRQALPLMMVLVEWFTNSCKYGAHCAPGGRVDVTWKLLRPGDDARDDRGDTAGAPAADDVHCDCPATAARVRLTWRESGGPPITAAGRPSIGTDLVRGFVTRELAGACRLSFPPGGAHHVMEFCPDAQPDEFDPLD